MRMLVVAKFRFHQKSEWCEEMKHGHTMWAPMFSLETDSCQEIFFLEASERSSLGRPSPLYVRKYIEII